MSQFIFEIGATVTHLKTGGRYQILQHARYEPSDDYVYVYQSSADGQIWVRPRREMEDGRFSLGVVSVNPAAQAGLLDPLAVLYTDGACKGNPGRGGWGVLLEQGSLTQELCGGESHTTNNRMELLAAIKGLQALPIGSQVELHTDSQYVQKGITEWIHGWKRRHWLKADGSAVVNKDLWVELDAEAAVRRVVWKWVRGHNGHPGNEAADRLANQGVTCGT
jgi:ribonuclease HI